MRFVFALLILFSLGARASETPKPVRALLAIGSEVRPERSAEGHIIAHNYPNYAIGAGFDQYLFVLERSTFEESSGNATLNVRQQMEDTLIWGQWRAFTANHFTPYVGLGLGAYQTKVTTSLAGANTVSNTSDYKMIGGGNLGVSLEFPYVFVSIEARALFGDELDPQPALGGLLRAGVWF